jgi:hypothetical protein
VNGHELGEQLYVPTNFYKPRLAASIVVPGHILVYGFTAYNSNAAARPTARHLHGRRRTWTLAGY